MSGAIRAMDAMDMTPLLSIAEMRALEAAAAADGADTDALMQAAGAAVADWVGAHHPNGRVLVLCGPGNNGGDGLVAARCLRRRGRSVDVFCLERANATPDDKHAPLTAEAAQRLAGDMNYSVVLDALFGAGLNRPLPPMLAPLAEASRRMDPPFVAVDVPSGLHGDSAQPLGALVFSARASIAFAAPRPAHYVMPGRMLCGRVHVADIGIRARRLKAQAPSVWLNAPEHWSGALPRRGLDSHKYRRGAALVVAGPAFATGAAELAALAALRLGAGLVTLAARPSALRTLQLTPEILRAPLGLWRAGLMPLVRRQRIGALLLGPHLAGGRSMGRVRRLVRAGLAGDAQLVLDADALTAQRTQRAWFMRALSAHARRRGQPAVLTPHAGEFERLFPHWLEEKGRLESARAAAQETHSVFVLKGADTIIAAPDGRALVNHNAPPSLAVAGSGDVLAGMITGLCAQGMPPWQAAAAAVWLHGRAACVLGAGLLAGELAHAAAQALAELPPAAVEDTEDIASARQTC